MSRFFTKSDSESESSASEDEVVAKPVPNRTFVQSDDDEETKRVVKSSKDKKYEELQTIIKNLRNHKKIKDMSNVLNDFEELGKALEKARKVIDKDGLPRFFIKCLVQLEDFVNAQWENVEGRKALNKNNSKGLTALRQKLKKYNKNFEEKIKQYRENPDQSDHEVEREEKSGDEEERGGDEEEDEEDEKEEDARRLAKSAVTEEAKKKQGDSDSDDMWEQDESSSDESDDDIRPINQLNADYFRKKVTQDGEGEGRRKKEEKKRKVVKKEESDAEEMGEWEKVGSSAAAEKPEIFGKDVEINVEVVKRKLIELSAGRGRKGTDRSMQVDLLIELRKIAREHNLGEGIDCKLLLCIITSIFDYNPSIAASMKPEMWERCLKHIWELLAFLNANVGSIQVSDHISEENENYTDMTAPLRVRGCMLTVVERMDEEFKLMLQTCDAHSTDYIDRLKDEKMVCQIIEELERYMAGHASDEELCRLYLKRIQHLYYKFDPKSYGTNAAKADPKSAQAVMDRLCRFIYTKDSTDRIRILAILSHVYHHALHDRYYDARDLMLMSHLQDDMALPRVPIQIKILYNRTTVQLGFCAFRLGLIKEAHNFLVEIQSSRRARELLAQGLLPQRQHDRTPEQEKKEKRQQVPYHMHINLELLECIYLVCAMLIEMPNMAAHEFEGRRKMISKNFHHVLREHDKQALVGHPESMREHMVAAFKAMKNAEWLECYNFIVNEKLNAKVWSLFSKYGDIKAMVKQKVKEESLRTYLFTYSSIFESNQLDLLAEMFELPISTVNSIVSKMIINVELMALIDEPSQCLEMHQSEASVVQSLALQLSEKLAQIVEQNERLLSVKVDGPNFFSYPQRSGGPNQGGYQQNQGGYQQRGNQARNQQQNYQGRRQGQRGQNPGYQQGQSQAYQGRRGN